jgi:hypothetical protein
MAHQDRGKKPEAGTLRQQPERALPRPSRLVRAFMVILVLCLWAPGAMATEPYEQPTERRAAEVLPPAMVVTPNYQVQDPVVADGYMDRFTVVSPFGTFEVTGQPPVDPSGRPAQPGSQGQLQGPRVHRPV